MVASPSAANTRFRCRHRSSCRREQVGNAERPRVAPVLRGAQRERGRRWGGRLPTRQEWKGGWTRNPLCHLSVEAPAIGVASQLMLSVGVMLVPSDSSDYRTLQRGLLAVSLGGLLLVGLVKPPYWLRELRRARTVIRDRAALDGPMLLAVLAILYLCLVLVSAGVTLDLSVARPYEVVGGVIGVNLVHIARGLWAKARTGRRR